MGDDPDQPKKVGSDMHAKKWSEYGGHGNGFPDWIIPSIWE